MLATHRKQSNLRGYMFRYVVREPEKKVLFRRGSYSAFGQQ